MIRPYRIIDDQYVDTVNMGELVEDAMPQILGELDPHSSYIPAKDLEAGSLQKSCDLNFGDDYCFSTKELWSIIFPSDSERIAISETRKMNEVCSLSTALFMEYIVT